MNPQFIISRVEVYERPKTFNMSPEWFHIKKLDHELPEDIKVEFNLFIKNRNEINENGISYNGKIYKCGDTIRRKFKGVPQEVIDIFYDIQYGKFTESTGIKSSITGHLYMFEHGSTTNLGYFPNQDKKFNDIYDKMWPHVKNIIDNYVGKPVRLTDLPVCYDSSISKYPDFSKDNFEISAGESNGVSVRVKTTYFKFCKLHLTDLNNKKIVKMCYCRDCNAYETK